MQRRRSLSAATTKALLPLVGSRVVCREQEYVVANVWHDACKFTGTEYWVQLAGGYVGEWVRLDEVRQEHQRSLDE